MAERDGGRERERLRLALERARFLGEASRLLSASLDPERTLDVAAHLVVPRVADLCLIDLCDADRRLRRAAVAHRDGAEEARLRSEDGPGTVVVAGAARDAVLSGASALAADRVVVPLVSRGRTLGALTLGIAERSARRFDEDDLEVAEELGRRIATAVDNARLYRLAVTARAEAEAASRAKTTFLATMSHELRTPMAAVLGYTDLMELGVAGPVTAQQQAYLDRIRGSGRHLLGLINEVLDFAKVEAGQMAVRRESARFTAAIETATTLVRPMVESGQLSLGEPHPCVDEVCYEGDEDRVRQIVVNLLSNAVKFTPAGGRVTIGCGWAHRPGDVAAPGARGAWVYLRVADTGIGVPADKMEAIFEPFVQVEPGHTRTHGGTGLGLAISRRFARLMRGELTVESIAGDGSAFTLWLPAARRRVPGRAPSDGGPRRGAAGRQIAARIPELIEGYVAQLRTMPDLPGVDVLSQADLEDHIATFLVDFAQLFSILDDPGADAVGLVRDGARVQHVLGGLHGAQRHRLGWSEHAIRSEFVVLTECVAKVLRLGLPDVDEVALDELLNLSDALMHEAAEVSVRGWRGAQSMAVQAPA